MHKLLLAAVMLSFSGLSTAQVINTDSTSSSTANSGSVSAAGASSDQQQGQSQGQSQGQAVDQGNVQATMLNFEASKIPRETTQHFKTNNSVPLAAAVSFSSDYCGGTVAAGASGLGISVGASAPKMDGNCQSLRRAEKFGVAAVTARNLGNEEVSGRLMAMMIWELCTSESNNDKSKGNHPPSTAHACDAIGLTSSGPVEPSSDSANAQASQAAATVVQSQRTAQAVQYTQDTPETAAVKVAGR